MRIDGEPITDIDAIGVLGDKIVAISCKSYLYTDEYDMGDYAAVRNQATSALGAARQWKSKMGRIEERMKGDNYDLSDYKSMVPIVVTPSVVYVNDEECLEYVMEDLRMVCSYSELERWSSQFESK